MFHFWCNSLLPLPLWRAADKKPTTDKSRKLYDSNQKHQKTPSPEPVGCTDDFIWTTPQMQGKVWKARHFVWQDLLLFRRDFSSPNRAFYAAAKVELCYFNQTECCTEFDCMLFMYILVCVWWQFFWTPVYVYACVCLTVAHLDCRKKVVKITHMSVCRLGCSKQSSVCPQVHRVRYSSFI